MMNIFHNNRWFIWTLVLVIAIGLLTTSYIWFSIGEFDKMSGELVSSDQNRAASATRR